MSRGRSVSVLWQIRSLFGRGSLAGLGEGRLIERFVADNDEGAFEVLMARHGSMVLGVCQRILDDPRDVEDAFQATFLVLVKKAGTLRDSNQLANWLYGVAHRVAARARANAYRRRLRERPGGEEVAVSTEPRECGAELRAVLDDELARLPDRLRAAVVLCDLEGLPQVEAARRLGCPVGTIKSRLSRAHDRLRVRLVRRGIVPSAMLAGMIVESGKSTAAVTAALKASTLEVASHFASGVAVPARTALLVEGVLRSMIMTKVKNAFTALLALSLVGVGAMALVANVAPGGQPNQPPAPRPIGEGQRDLRVNFKLQQGIKRPEVSGVVRLPDRTPVAGAEVYLVTPSKRLDLKNGRAVPAMVYPGMRVDTGPDGRFSFKSPDERAAVVVLHDRGFAQRGALELANSPDMVLEAWARIEGTLRVGGRPGANETVNVEDYRSILLEPQGQMWEYGAKVDENGHFVIERVMPSEWATVERQIRWRLGRLAAVSTPPFPINPGETARVELGGAGRLVVGRLVPAEGGGPAGDFTYARGTLSLKLPAIPTPEGYVSWTELEQQEFMKRFWASPEGWARRQRVRVYAFKVSDDGSFRVEDVPPGAYELTIEALAHRPPYTPIARAKRDVAVTEIPAGGADKPLYLGAVWLALVPE